MIQLIHKFLQNVEIDTGVGNRVERSEVSYPATSHPNFLWMQELLLSDMRTATSTRRCAYSVELTYPDRYNPASSQNFGILAVFLHVRRLEFSDSSNMVLVNPSLPCRRLTVCQSPVRSDVMNAGEVRSGCRVGNY